MTPAQIKAARVARGLTQSEIAERLGVSANTWARWERGELEIGNETMLARALRSIPKRTAKDRPDGLGPLRSRRDKAKA